VTGYIEERREVFGVEPICGVLGVPVNTHYARRSGKTSRRELADRELLAGIEAARTGYRRVYGARKTWLELRRRGIELVRGFKMPVHAAARRYSWPPLGGGSALVRCRGRGSGTAPVRRGR
jgi:putative transposase